MRFKVGDRVKRKRINFKRYITAYLVFYSMYDDKPLDNIYFSEEKTKRRVKYLNKREISKKDKGWRYEKIKVFM